MHKGVLGYLMRGSCMDLCMVFTLRILGAVIALEFILELIELLFPISLFKGCCDPLSLGNEPMYYSHIRHY